jgi:hypothetical protein
MPSITTPISRAKRQTRNESSSIIGSIRDSGMVSKQWQKDKRDSDNQFSATNALSKLQSDVAKLRKIRAGGYIPSEQINYPLPLEIYQIGSNNPPTFQIRDGIVSARSRYWLAGNTKSGGGANPVGGDYFAYQSDQRATQSDGNFEVYLNVVADGQGQYNQNGGSQSNLTEPTYNKDGTPANLSLTADVLISGFTSLGVRVQSDYIVFPDIVGIEGGAGLVTVGASFWVEIVDDPTLGIYANLWGRVTNFNKYTSGDVPQAQDFVYPNAGNASINYGNVTYPIGSVEVLYESAPSAGGEKISQFSSLYSFSQLQIGNLVNRFPSYANKNGGLLGNPMIYRGRWSTDTLSGQVFYPGDFVYDDTAGTGGGYLTKTTTAPNPTSFKYRGQYIYQKTIPSFITAAPSGGSSDWLYIGSVI